MVSGTISMAPHACALYGYRVLPDSTDGAYPLDLKDSYQPLIDWKETKEKLEGRGSST